MVTSFSTVFFARFSSNSLSFLRPLQFSTLTPDGVFLISASKDGKPMLRNGMNGDWIGTFEGHKGAVWSAVLNKPAWVAATASADFTAKVRTTRQFFSILDLKESYSQVLVPMHLRMYLPEGLRQNVTFFQNTAPRRLSVQIWDAASGDELYSFQHKHIVRCCAFAEDSNRLATGGMEKLVRIFDIEQPSSDPIEVRPVFMFLPSFVHLRCT